MGKLMLTKSTCRACKATILWAKTGAGKNIPLNEFPEPGGNIRLEPGGDIAVNVPKIIAERPENDLKLYKSHFATCPNAHQFRK